MSSKKKLIRNKFRDSVFSRDNYMCKFCDCIDSLDAHHITDRSLMPNGGYVESNGITLCKFHHGQAEQFHTTNGQDWQPNMHPNDLYKLIGSNKEKAEADSKRLTL